MLLRQDALQDKAKRSASEHHNRDSKRELERTHFNPRQDRGS